MWILQDWDHDTLQRGNGMEWVLSIASQLRERVFLLEWTNALKTAEEIKT